MSWSQISRFGALKNFQLKNCALLLKVSSRENQYFLSCDCMLLPRTVSRSLSSQTACSPEKVYSADKTWAVHDADRTFALQTTHRTHAIHSTVTRRSLQIRNPMNLYLNVLLLHSSGRRNFSTSSARTDKQNQLQSKDAAMSTDNAGVNREQAKPETDLATNGSVKEGGDAVKKLTLYQWFKKTYKEHGKILVAVHLLTSAVWFGSFYTVARCGVDVVSFMEKLNFSEKIISPFRSGGLGDVAVAYLMYKLATPARYTVTIGGTNLAIKYLRKEGKIPHVPHEDRFRSLYTEGKEHFKKRSRIHMRRLRKKHGIKSRFGHTKEKH
ncbi:unnamed protein product [Candidula unifasciata]|uniref:DUF1279 domain-containing protein n=1 Tax=Candidula unifasciata TaxID=100452 RepID=A0A8S3Z2M0_9EUPU|nr:unnamed protein product [Candidula unifasciata]